MSKKVWRNPFTGKRYKNAESCIANTESLNGDQLDQLGVTAAQAVFNYRNNYPVDQKFGKSILSGKPTAWNEKARRYERLADDKERERFREIFVKRMQARYGKTHLLDDPEQQRKMLENRKISGQYTFSDGASKVYTGTYEQDFLEFMDNVLNWPSSDIHSPAPQTFYYKDEEGKDRFYIPDFWIESLNLYIEVKSDDNKHYRLRDIAVERQKDSFLKSTNNNYIKVVEKRYGDFLETLSTLINDF